MFFNKIHIRIRCVYLFVIILLIAVIFKVFYIQVFSYDKLKKLSDSLYSRKLPIAADRGEILDRNGEVLATNITTTSLVLIPRQIVDKEQVAQDLADILGVTYEEMYRHVSKRESIERVHPEGRRLDYETAEKIENLGYDGVYLVKESKRYYPYGDLLSHVLGYVGIDNQGLSGIELQYDEYLTGEDGSIKYFSDGQGSRLKMSEVYEAATSGVSIQLTIDIELQKAIESELDNVISKYQADNALIVVQDPQSGEILAMASRPAFDSNDYQNFSTEVINRNLPIWKTYEPGSTFKIITLAASLEEKTIDLFNDTFSDSGAVNVDGATLHCWKHGGHGAQTYLQVVENSCNPGFVNMGLKLGTNTLMKYIRNFGFGEKTGIDLNGEASGILFKEEKMGNVETATTAFGQGISVTPIQQITAVSAAVNGGNLYIPYIVKSLIDTETETVLDVTEKKLRRKVISKDTSDLVRYTLESVVANGTGKNAYIENYRVGGKTGTAQKVENGHYSTSSYILSFIGFMPADNPQIVVYVAVDSPHNVTQYGGTVSAPIAKNVMKSAIDILEIKPSKEGMPKEYTWLDEKYVLLPDVKGMALEEAKKVLKGFNVIYSGNGDKIAYQSPEAGMYIKESGNVVLMLN
ncbi:MAG: stage V sporulation protein D [Firmicutes bacterium]|nr:stage V sporulation protein D [Bacillota bacterium]